MAFKVGIGKSDFEEMRKSNAWADRIYCSRIKETAGQLS